MASAQEGSASKSENYYLGTCQSISLEACNSQGNKRMVASSESQTPKSLVTLAKSANSGPRRGLGNAHPRNRGSGLPIFAHRSNSLQKKPKPPKDSHRFHCQGYLLICRKGGGGGTLPCRAADIGVRGEKVFSFLLDSISSSSLRPAFRDLPPASGTAGSCLRVARLQRQTVYSQRRCCRHGSDDAL